MFSGSSTNFFCVNSLDLLAAITTHIINSSFDENKFPEQLKHALVTPLVKDNNGNLDDFKNYRPVSILPFLSKVLEKCVYKSAK